VAKLVLRLISLLGLIAGSVAIAPSTALASTTYSCLDFSTSDGIHTGGNDDFPRWGWALTVHSPACNHWGSVALHEALPSGFQVNVTLTRWDGDFVFDHRYCHVYPGGTNCHTAAILTTACNWSYTTNAQIYHWNGTAWDLIAFNTTPPRTFSCSA
jgi:hypothetical protein